MTACICTHALCMCRCRPQMAKASRRYSSHCLHASWPQCLACLRSWLHLPHSKPTTRGRRGSQARVLIHTCAVCSHLQMQKRYGQWGSADMTIEEDINNASLQCCSNIAMDLQHSVSELICMMGSQSRHNRSMVDSSQLHAAALVTLCLESVVPLLTPGIMCADNSPQHMPEQRCKPSCTPHMPQLVKSQLEVAKRNCFARKHLHSACSNTGWPASGTMAELAVFIALWCTHHAH